MSAAVTVTGKVSVESATIVSASKATTSSAPVEVTAQMNIVISASSKEAAANPPKKIQRAYILTGGPSVGKSTILTQLEMHYKVSIVTEAATSIIGLEKAKGDKTPWASAGFHDRILALQEQREAHAKASNAELVFCDRAPLDILAYEKKPSSQLLAKISSMQTGGFYQKTVFLIENLGKFEENGIRYEDLDGCIKLEAEQEKNYQAHGFTVVRIKPGTPEQRAKAIYDRVMSECNSK